MFNLNTLRQIEDIIIKHSDRVLLPLLNKTTADIKSDGSIVTEADLAMQSAIEQTLKQTFGSEIKLLGEECEPQIQQDIVDNESQFWVFDPVDGTTNFHAGFPVFCTSLALIKDHQVQLGITYDPVRKECFSALKSQGFYYNQQLFEIAPQQVTKNLNDCIAFVDFKRVSKDKGVNLITETPFKSQRNIGSSALEWAWLAMNRAQISFHGGQKLWDYAAGSLLLSEAGGFSSDLLDKNLYQKTMDVRPIIAATSEPLKDKWLKHITMI